jgi:hypothetical protein
MTTGHLQNSLNIYELAKDGNGADDFDRKYFHISPTRGVTIPLNLSAVSGHEARSEPYPPLSTAQINATMKCVNTAHAILDTFLGMTITVMRQAPGVLYVRATNAIQTLMNISLTAVESSLGEYLDITSLKLEFYHDRLLRQIEEASGPEKFKIPSHWLEILYKIKGLYDKYGIEVDLGQSRDYNASSAVDQQTPEHSTTQLRTNDSRWDTIPSARPVHDPRRDAFSQPNINFSDDLAATAKPQDEEQQQSLDSLPENLDPSDLSSIPVDSLDFDINDSSFWDDSAADFNTWAGNDVFGDMNLDTMGNNQTFRYG